jgi:hypothetical protein
LPNALASADWPDEKLDGGRSSKRILSWSHRGPDGRSRQPATGPGMRHVRGSMTLLILRDGRDFTWKVIKIRFLRSGAIPIVSLFASVFDVYLGVVYELGDM